MENFNIYGEIGRGSHSFVYKARRKRSIEYVAVKSTAKSRMDKILHEVPFLHKLDSPFVLKFVDWYESSNHIWLILEYCMGGDLLNLITHDKQLPESVVKSFGLELVAGLQYLHANSILYCDLKPANVLIDEFGSLKLSDFGLARRIPERDAAPSRPLAPGSPHYMAPELFQQPAVHSFASDFWALGCVLFELRTGRQPFRHTRFSELARKIQTEKVGLPVPGCSMSLEFCNLLTRLLTKDPYQRISWNELVEHPFWNSLPRLEHVKMPPQERFDWLAPSSLNTLSADCPEAGTCKIPQRKSEDKNETKEGANTLEPEASDADAQQSQTNEIEAATTDEEADALDSESLRPQTAARSDKSQPVTEPIIRRRPSQINRDDIADSMRVRAELSTESNQMVGIQHRWQTPTTPHSALRGFQHRPNRRLKLSAVCNDKVDRGNGLRKISELVFTAADCRVKSIIENQYVELENLPKVKPEHLRFALIEPERLLSSTTEVLEKQLKEIYMSLNDSSADEAEKLCCMAYLRSLSSHTQLAPVIANSSILKLLIRMLAQEAQLSTLDKTILSMLCLVLGTLFRFATIVASSLPDPLHLLVSILVKIVASSPEDRNTSALQSRSIAIASLGELLVYIMTQQQWELPTKGVATVLACVDDQDIAARYYAVRTLNNMLIHCTEALLPKLISDKTVLALFRRLLQCNRLELDEQEAVHELHVALRTSITEALAHVLRHVRTPSSSAHLSSRLKRSIALYFAKPEHLNAVWRGVGTQGSMDLTIASLNIVNAFLDMKVSRDSEAEYVAIKSSRTLLLERIVTVSSIQKAMEIDRSADDKDDEKKRLVILRAKSLIMLHLGSQLSRAFLFLVVESKALTLVERVMDQIVDQGSDRTSCAIPPSVEEHLSTCEMYLTQCTLNLCKLMIRIALKLGADCFSSEGRRYDHAEHESRMISPIPFQFFRALLEHPNWRHQFFTYFITSDRKQFTFFLRLLTKLLSSFGHNVLAIQGETKTATTVARFVSSLLQNLFHFAATEAQELFVLEKRELITHFLPAMVKHMDSNEALENDGEHHVTVNCLEVLRTVLLNFHDAGEDEMNDMFVRSLLFPYLNKLVRKRHLVIEKIWSLSSDIVFGLVSRKQSLLRDAVDLNLVPIGIGLLCVPPTFTSLPSSATRLVQLLVDARDGKFECLFESGMARAMVTGLTFAARRSKTDASVLDLVAILQSLLRHRFQTMREQHPAPALVGFDELVASGPLLLQFCAWRFQQGRNGQVPSVRRENAIDTFKLLSPELAKVASCCLVLLSQIFGERLNDVMFTASAPESTASVMRWILSCLQAEINDEDMDEDGVIVHRVLLALNNCLRCEGNYNLVRRWMAENAEFRNVLALLKQPVYSKVQVESRSSSIQEQISKTAAATERLVCS
ncbi:hypothetical protein PsorP6_001909 [Peronosclerospora sorghi]|uniref:Uncharacterized protein n=1 Tax=Peronosclerospora sorghi TaxID=230839 RepID=A0ACC0WUW5_9STRA|nr:hypothetical protein PsorP6_001909 [Peronosclerospora sorghi]